MLSYKLSPFVHFIESQLIPAVPQYAVFHRLTGELVELAPVARALLLATQHGSLVSFDEPQIKQLGEAGLPMQTLIEQKFLTSDDFDPLAAFADHYVVMPLQNPAVAYVSETRDVVVVRLSMAEKVYSPESQKLPALIEERMPPLATEIFLAADGTRRLRELHTAVDRHTKSLSDDEAFRAAIDFLTQPERQLIKIAAVNTALDDPFQPANTVPRNLYHLARWSSPSNTVKSLGDFHVEGIDDALWEFDIVEPTVNHALRFPTDILGGLNYGSRFCDAALKPNIVPASHNGQLKVLEVGGGTGSFARSFIERARSAAASLKYHVMDLSPALAESQRRVLSDVEPAVTFIAQDATEFDLPGEQFDLIISNEVIADFPVAMVERRSTEKNALQFAGEGAVYVKEYALSVDDAPDRFYVNAGVFRFLERAWIHLKPAGIVILSEYGSESVYPTESFHLNHSEFSIHFGHVAECARKIGFQCRMQTLKEFLAIDDRRLVLNGREEHIRCLNCVFEKFGMTIPFALFTQTDFEARFGELAARINLNPVRFLPLSSNFYYGAEIDQFLVLIMVKPTA